MEINQETFQALKEAAVQFCEAFKKAVPITHFYEVFGKLIERYKDVEEQHQNNVMNRTGRRVDFDMRKCSQVISNKPKFAVRKFC